MREQALELQQGYGAGNSLGFMSHKICYVGNISFQLQPATSAGSVVTIPGTPRPVWVSGLWK